MILVEKAAFVAAIGLAVFLTVGLNEASTNSALSQAHIIGAVSFVVLFAYAFLESRERHYSKPEFAFLAIYIAVLITSVWVGEDIRKDQATTVAYWCPEEWPVRCA